MKRFFSFLLLSALLLTLLPTAHAADAMHVALTKELIFTNEAPEQAVLTVSNPMDRAVDITVTVFDEAARATVQTLQFTMQAGDAPVEVMGYVYKPLQKHGQINTYRYHVSTAGGFKRNYFVAQVMRIDRDTQMATYLHTENPKYARNTICSFGPQFRIVTPQLTDKWFMFTPIDLTVQGRQTFPLIGGNSRIVGETYVDVSGDQVTVTYTYFHEFDAHTKVERLSDFITFFPAYSTITTVEPQEINSPFAFGRPFSIAEQLGGDTNVLMFICNTESFYRYPTPTAEMPRFHPRSEAHMAMRQQMLDLMDPMDGLNLSNDHNYAK